MNPPGVIPYERHRPTRVLVRRLADRLTAGGLAVFPTETQYTLSADALSAVALDRLRAAKGRDAARPLSVFFSSPGDLDRFKVRVPAWALPLAETFWPGPLTLVLPTGDRALGRLGGQGTVGVRFSPEPIVRAVARAVARPLVATSANPSGMVWAARAENRWLAQLAADGILIWARPQRYRRRTPSTVIDCTGTRPRLLRDGAIPKDVWRPLVRQTQTMHGGFPAGKG